MLLDVDNHHAALGDVDAIAVYRVDDLNDNLLYDAIAFQADAQLISDVLDNVAFDRPIDGNGLGVEQDAILYIKSANGMISKYIVVDDFRFVLRDGDWSNMFTMQTTAADAIRSQL
jgi:hypothetical protein